MAEYVPKIEEILVTHDTAAYAAEDVVGGTLSCDAYAGEGGGAIAWVRVVDDDDEKKAARLYVYIANPSAIADNGAFVPTEEDLLKCIGCIDIPASKFDASGADAYALVAGKDRMTGQTIFYPNTSDGKLYFRYVTAEAVTYTAADDLSVHVCLLKR